MGKVKAGDLVVLVAAGLVDMLAQHFAQGFLHQVGSGVVAADGSAALFIHSSGYGIAYACILNIFDAGSKEAYLALLQLINIDDARLEVTNLGNIKFRTGCHHANLHALAQTALHKTNI